MKNCSKCGYGHLIEEPPGPDLCEHCGTALNPLDEIRELVRMQNVSAKRVNRIRSDEEERQPIILVADDSSVARNQIKRTLQQLGIECVLANDGKQALEMLKQWAENDDELPLHERLCMVISDIEMPEMDGYTFTTEVRKDPRMSDLHILLHTSLSGVFNKAMVEKVGADDFIAKFQPDVLAKSVLSRLKRWQDTRAA